MTSNWRYMDNANPTTSNPGPMFAEEHGTFILNFRISSFKNDRKAYKMDQKLPALGPPLGLAKGISPMKLHRLFLWRSITVSVINDHNYYYDDDDDDGDFAGSSSGHWILLRSMDKSKSEFWTAGWTCLQEWKTRQTRKHSMQTLAERLVLELLWD